MLITGQSGQFIYFSMLSAASGLPITGIASGNISGNRAFDGAGVIVTSGPIIEDGMGMYHINLHAFDVSGRNGGFMFTASGAVPQCISVVTTNGVSGQLFPVSGTYSGLLNVNVLSGQSINVYSGQLSGQQISLFSGSLSGQLVGVLSGQLSGQQVNLLSGNQTQVWSGTFVNVFSGQLSGQPVTAFAVSDKNNYSLNGSGLDSITVESGMNMRQAQAVIAASAAGQLSGAGTLAVRIQAANNSGQNRIAATVDNSGNRVSTALTLPT